MLSRTADQLFWMARYTERAENTARMLDANYQLSLLPQSDDYAAACWRSMLSVSELSAAYEARHGEVSSHGVIAFMARDRDNFSSIVNCLRAARENARAARPQITAELWETLNTTWLDVQRLLAGDALARDPVEFFEWVKYRSHLARGVMVDTLLRDDALRFLRLGTFIERADNTARILDVRCAVPRERGGVAGAASDFYHWSAVLRAVSGQDAYHKLYRDVVTPARVAELLILNRRWPRSLAANVEEVIGVLEALNAPGGGQGGALAGGHAGAAVGAYAGAPIGANVGANIGAPVGAHTGAHIGSSGSAPQARRDALPDDASGEAPGKALSEMSNEVPGKAPSEAPNEVPGKASSEVLNEVPGKASGGAVNAASSASIKASGKALSEVPSKASSKVPDNAPDAAPADARDAYDTHDARPAPHYAPHAPHACLARNAHTAQLAQALWAELRDGDIAAILGGGVHGYLTGFLARINDLASRVSRDFLVPIVEETEPELEPAQTQARTQTQTQTRQGA